MRAAAAAAVVVAVVVAAATETDAAATAAEVAAALMIARAWGAGHLTVHEILSRHASTDIGQEQCSHQFQHFDLAEMALS